MGLYTVNCGDSVKIYDTELGSVCSVICGINDEIEIIYSGEVNKLYIGPESRCVKAEVKENHIFIKAREEKLVFVVNDDLENPLYLFIKNKENIVLPPDAQSNEVIYFGGEKTYDAGEIHMKSGQTLWIDYGTVVNGCIIADGAENINIRGYGILNASNHQNGLQILNCNNVEISDLTLIKGSVEWANRIFCSRNVNIRDYKVISWGRYSDGLDLLGSQNVVAERLFIRSEDDSIVLKTDKFGYKGSVKNIAVRDSVIWNGHGGNGIEIGYELNDAEVCDVLFENIDIIRTDEPTIYFRCGALTIHNAGNGNVHDITYKDIRVESARQDFIYIGTIDNIEEWGKGGGSIRNIVLDNITLTGGMEVPSFIGSDNEGRVSGVVFKNCDYLGRRIKDAEDFNMTAKNTEVIFEERQ